MAEQNMMQRTKKLPSMEARSHRPSSFPSGSTNKEILGDGTDIHSGSSDENNEEL